MTHPTDLHELMAAGAAPAIALSAPGRAALSFGALRKQLDYTVAGLNRLGIGRNDRVALVMPNGPDMASAFIAVAAGATAAPLNPAYGAEEFNFYLTDLGAKALIVERGSTSPAVAVAHKLGLCVSEIEAEPCAGAFRLIAADGGTGVNTPALSGFALADEIALALHTSGTTSRPKIVPLSQRNICASATNIRTVLELGPDDRGLNIMPLFHIHGLMASVLAPLAAGGSVFCTPGFNALKFFCWMEESRPTWYTAVPTMHQTILSRAERNRAIIDTQPLRFIRSSSSALPAPVIQQLETAFGAPVLESYGMTEAAHQMTSNPLPPRERRPGTVGIAAGPEVAIMDRDGVLLPPGTSGEIVIRGGNVTAGYENNRKANTEAFANGWFHTGDLGSMSADGYLSLTGRLKEIINRGGEKISPREVDDVLLEHPAVHQAVTFAVPHDKLGEDVAAAIVLHDGADATEKELREFVANRLVEFKVPRKILILEEIPKGATGKLQRIGLAEKLGLA
ncbi:MAG: acyl--CoA ligase [Burkholderiales bacterium]